MASQPPSFLFAPGAGAPSTSAWMVGWRERLSSLGAVTAFDYPYMRSGRKSPDRLPVLIEAHRVALAAVRAESKGPVFLIGKSMGGRVGCHLALEEQVAGVICLGYPLKSGATGALRDEVLVALRRPILFVQGSRDPLCPLDQLAEVRDRMTAPSTLLIVEGGNHSLELSKGRGKPASNLANKPASKPASNLATKTASLQGDSNARVLEAIGAFCSKPRSR